MAAYQPLTPFPRLPPLPRYPRPVTHDSRPYDVIAWTEHGIRLLDQTLLPEREQYASIETVEALAEAIRSMRVRGAPAIGIAAAYGLALAAHRAPSADARHEVRRAAELLAATRPTAVNLRWALDRVASTVERAPAAEAAAVALAETRRIHAEQVDADSRIAQAGAALLAPGSRLLTHCNTGPLATGGLGTALGVVIEAHRRGLLAGVLVDETRPRLQGARLTAWELGRHAVPYEVIVDGAAAALMARGRVDAVIVGADRIAANGDVANKIGTYGLAIAARHHGIPFYVAAPVSTIDPATPSGEAIPIEERDEDEVLSAAGARLAAPGAHALNPAFDVTPAALVTAIITERGVLRAPYPAAIAALAAVPASSP
jgi:methylthioribose-1-phosphate isomerase